MSDEAEPAGDDEAWAEYLRTSPIMSNVPLTTHPSERVHREAAQHPPTWTRPVAYIVAIPALWALFNLIILLAGALHWWMVFTSLALAGAASVMFARADQRMLAAAGQGQTASPRLAFVPLLYLAQRAKMGFTVTVNSYQPLWRHVAVIIGLCVALLATAVIGGIALKLAETWVLLGTMAG